MIAQQTIHKTLTLRINLNTGLITTLDTVEVKERQAFTLSSKLVKLDINTLMLVTSCLVTGQLCFKEINGTMVSMVCMDHGLQTSVKVPTQQLISHQQ